MSSTTRSVAVIAGILSLAVVLAGCGTTLVSGQASSGEPPITDVAPADLPITGSVEAAVDVTARNALVDLGEFWDAEFPQVFDEEFAPLEGGVFSVDAGDYDSTLYPDGLPCDGGPSDVEGNAYYCGDAITYDRNLLEELAADYGSFLPAMVMAHEFGHAVQDQIGYPADALINIETQADCFSGAWSRWVADGNAEHESVRAPELDELLRGYITLRDPVGAGIDDQQSHGSYFDRVSALQDGFDGGAAACRDNYGSDRVFTQGSFTDDDIANGGGNLPLDEVPDLVDRSLPIYYEDSFPDDLGAEFTPPTIEPFNGTAPSCAGMNTDTNAGFCPDEDIVYYDQTDLAGPAYEIGDYAVVTAVAIPYGIAARDQLGLSIDDEDAIRSATCQAGAFSGAVLYGEVPTISISPGDFDEAVQFLLAYGNDTSVFPDVGLSGFQLVDVFRQGFLFGLTACGLEA